MEYKLNQSQRNAVCKYIKDGYVIIESGKASGKTQTLWAIIDFWIKYTANDNDVCVVIGKTFNQIIRFSTNLTTFLRNVGIYKIEYNGSNIVKIIKPNDKVCYIKFCESLNNYFINKRYCYSGYKITLLIGDELYIDPDWCEHTACAYTQYRDVVSLSYDGTIDKEELERIRKIMSKRRFDREFGQYM